MGSTSRLNVKMAAELSHRCLVVDVAPHGHHEAAMFVVARLCVFAGPTSHASPSGSTGAGFAPTPLSSGGRPR